MENNIYGWQLALTERKGGGDWFPRPGMSRGKQGSPCERGSPWPRTFLISGKDLEKEDDFPESWPSLRAIMPMFGLNPSFLHICAGSCSGDGGAPVSSHPGKAVRRPGTPGARLADPVAFHLLSSFPRHH